MNMIKPSSICSERLTLSMGVANFTQFSSLKPSFEYLFNVADKELYREKELIRHDFSIVTRVLTPEEGGLIQ
ncbi:hypothetical protein ACP3VV_13070 [Vibrio sp. PNB22_8_2]